MADNQTTTAAQPADPANPPAADDGRFVEYNGERLKVDDNFWDKDNDQPNIGAILKSSMDLRKQIGEDKSPADGKYEIVIPDDLKEAIVPNPEDPLFVEFSKIAKKNRMSQEEWNAVTDQYFHMLNDKFSELSSNNFDPDQYYEQESQRLSEKFGNKTEDIKNRIETYLSNAEITDPDILQEIEFMKSSAAGVAVLNHFISAGSDPMPSAANTTAEPALSRDELENLMRQEGYQNGTDKVLIDKVTKGFEKLFTKK